MVILLLSICLLFPTLVIPQTAASAETISFGNTQNIFDRDELSGNPFESDTEISGNFAIAGAPDQDLDVKGASCLTNAGAAYIYELDINDDWVKKQKIVASDRQENDLFGWTAAISGNYAVVSAPYEDHDTQGGLHATSSGSVYIFQRDRTDKWIEKQKLVASDRAIHDQFGSSVSISGNYLIIGSHKKEEFQCAGINIRNTGAAYIFERDQFGYWKEVQKITTGEHKAVDGFGYLVSIFDNHTIIGARSQNLSKDSNQKNNDSWKREFSGADSAYIYERNEKGVWNLKQKVIDPKLTFLCLEKLY